MKKGLLLAVATYILWGILPIYWKQLSKIPAAESLAHRVLWAGLILFLLQLIRRRGAWWRQLRSWQAARNLLLATLCLSLNWGLYIWAVNQNFIVEASLGYFINPLVSVLFGVLFLGEMLRPGQWGAIGVALVGVLYLTFGYGSFPWIGLSLAFSFAAYALFKKRSPFTPLDGLSLEIGLVWLPALGYLAFLSAQGQGQFGQPPLATNLLLLGTGLITAVPLLLFGNAAQRIPLAYIGLLQYINPSLQLAIGTLVYGEPFSPQRALGYGLVWSALLVFSIEGIWSGRRARRLATIS